MVQPRNNGCWTEFRQLRRWNRLTHPKVVIDDSEQKKSSRMIQRKHICLSLRRFMTSTKHPNRELVELDDTDHGKDVRPYLSRTM